MVLSNQDRANNLSTPYRGLYTELRHFLNRSVPGVKAQHQESGNRNTPLFQGVARALYYHPYPLLSRLNVIYLFNYWLPPASYTKGKDWISFMADFISDGIWLRHHRLLLDSISPRGRWILID